MKDIFDFIKSQENNYNNVPIPIVENWEWHMARHVKLTTLYMNSQYETGNSDLKPFKNIVLPALNVQHRSVTFNIKDIKFFIDDKDEYYKAFLVRKFHEKWARENGLANFLDEMTEQYSDYGGTLIKRTKNSVPIVIPFQQLAFCDQTDIISGPICEKHQYTPDGLKEMEKFHWGDSKYGATATVDDVIRLALEQKTTTQVQGRIIQTPSKYIEVYELHGVLPARWLLNIEDDPEEVGISDYERQVQIVAFYKDSNDNAQGVVLFKGKEKDNRYKLYKRDPIYGRALGRGGVEELFESQVWVNYSEIAQKEMLDQASKIIYQTSDTSYATRNQTNDVENGQILITAEGKQINQVNTSPVNLVAFEKAIAEWDAKAKEISSSFNPFAGSSRLSAQMGALLQKQASSLHDYRKGKIGGSFLPEVYKDWILPEMVKEMSNEQEFSSNLSLDEMNMVAESVINCTINDHIKNKILQGFVIQPGEIETLQQEYKKTFMKSGSQKFFSLIQGEMKDIPIEMIVDVTGEEMIGSAVAETLSTIFSELVPVLGRNPQFFQQNPAMAKIFQDIIASSGLNPMNYDLLAVPNTPAPAAGGGEQQENGGQGQQQEGAEGEQNDTTGK